VFHVHCRRPRSGVCTSDSDAELRAATATSDTGADDKGDVTSSQPSAEASNDVELESIVIPETTSTCCFCTSATFGGVLFSSPFVCLSSRINKNSRSCGQIFTKFWEGILYGPEKEDLIKFCT